MGVEKITSSCSLSAPSNSHTLSGWWAEATSRPSSSGTWRKNIFTISSSRICLASLRRSRTPLQDLTLTANAEAWPHMRAWPWSSGSSGRSLSAPRWRQSSSGASVGPGSTKLASMILPNPGRMAGLSVLIHNFFPNAFDFKSLKTESPGDRKKNFELAFTTGEKFAGVPDFLTAEDMSGMVEERRIDPKMVFSYVQEVYRMCNEL